VVFIYVASYKKIAIITEDVIVAITLLIAKVTYIARWCGDANKTRVLV